MVEQVEPQDRIYEEDERGHKVLVRSIESSKPAFLRFTNKTNRPVDIWWRDYRGDRRFYTRIMPRSYFNVNTFITHPWEFTDSVTKEHFIVQNNIIFRSPPNIGGMEFRTNWNITAQLRTLKSIALRRLGRSYQDPNVAYELGLPTTLANELNRAIILLHTMPTPIQ